jgi:alkylation response protein AidB-like acyl-CoA dehydrogenase/predicted thioesterase
MRWNGLQTELREQFRLFGRDQVAARADRLYAEGAFDRESWQRLAELGFWRIPVPVADGGHGHGWREFAAALEGLAAGARDLGFLLSLVAQIGFVRTLLRHGSPEQRRTFLPTLLEGGVGATALTERTAGSDLSRLRTSAVATPDGYRLNGEKAHITNAPITDLVLVLGRVPELGDKRDITVFLVESSRPGVERGRAETMLGNRTSPTGPIRFRDVELGSGRVLGTPGDGLRLIYETIAMDRLAYGIVAGGYIEPLLESSLRFAATRSAFRSKLEEYQYVQGRLTDIKIAMESARWISRAALEQLLDDDPEASSSCSIAKLVGAEAVCTATKHAMAVHGHTGYEDGPVARSVADALGTLIAGGTLEMQRKNIFNQLRQTGAARANGDGVAPPEAKPRFRPGLTGEIVHEVRRDDTAAEWGNELEVLATPVLLWLAEVACMRALDGLLGADEMTLGGAHDVAHLAPTPLADAVRVRATLTEVEDGRLTFAVSAADGEETVLEGTHTRFVVDRDRFLRRVESKRQKVQRSNGDRPTHVGAETGAKR